MIMVLMNKRQRMKLWVKNNGEVLVAAGVVVSVVGLFVLVVKADMARVERLTAELNRNVDELNNWYVIQNELGKESHEIATELEKLARDALIRAA